MYRGRAGADEIDRTYFNFSMAVEFGSEAIRSNSVATNTAIIGLTTNKSPVSIR